MKIRQFIILISFLSTFVVKYGSCFKQKFTDVV